MRVQGRIHIILTLLYLALLSYAQEPVNPSSVQKLQQEFVVRQSAQQGPLYQVLKQEEQGPMGAINLDPGMELVGVDTRGTILVYRVDNLVAAQTSRVPEIWPGGIGGYNLNGSTLFTRMVGVWDGGKVRTTHQEFGGRASQQDGATALHYHATHVAGTMIAAGVNPDAQGMAWGGYLYCYDWNSDNIEMLAAATNAMLVSNHSYGLVTGWDYNTTAEAWYWYGTPSVSETEDYKFGNYNSWVRAWDEIAYTAPLYLIVKSAGNDRNDAGPTPGGEHYVWNGSTWALSTTVRDEDGGATGYDTVPANGVAKNILTIGAIDDIPGGYTGPTDVVMSDFSGWGPCDDGRIKPDLVANGVGLLSTAETSNSAYITLSGTSMASPTAAGIAALLAEHYRATHGNQIARSSTLKAVMIHSADEAGDNPGPDYRFGWGLLNARAAADLISEDVTTAETIRQLTLADGDTLGEVWYTSGTDTIRATLAWIDPPGTAQGAVVDPTTPNIVHDLDLCLTRISDGVEFKPWTLDRDNPTAAAVAGDNVVDNVEQVVLFEPEPGNYELRITHKGTLTASQQVSLIVTGFEAVGMPPVAYNPVPANGATGIERTDGISWETGAIGDSVTVWDVYYGTDSTAVEDLDVSVRLADDLPSTTTSFDYTDLNGGSPLPTGTKHYWKIVSFDAQGDSSIGNLWSYTTAKAGSYVVVSATADNGLIDSANAFGLAYDALDGYDDYDTPEPPNLPTSYLSLYSAHPGWSPVFVRKLAEDFRDRDANNPNTTTSIFDLEIATNADGVVTVVFDALTGNENKYPALLYDNENQTLQNLYGASDADNQISYTADGSPTPTTRAFTLMYGDETGPELTITAPPSDGSGEFFRGSNNTITVDPDDTTPLRYIYSAFSDGTEELAGDDGLNRTFTNLSMGVVGYGSVDDPTDGIDNPSMSWEWNPVGDDPGLVGTNDTFTDGQLRFIAEDWMGNVDTSYVNVSIVPDTFAYTGDYATGWHLVSIPMIPADTLSTTLFDEVFSGGDGIYGDFEMFEYDVPNGLQHPAVVGIGPAYWLVLDRNNTAAANNEGLGTIEGTSTQSLSSVDLELTPEEQNLIGVPLRANDLGSGALQAQEWQFSDDGTSWYSWTDATSTASKGGDTNIWINPVSLKGYDNLAGDYTATIAEDTDLVPGVGYMLEAGTVLSGQLFIRTELSNVEGDFEPVGEGGNQELDELDEFTGEWFVPIRMELNGFYNDLSGFGAHPEAVAEWDLRRDVNRPPAPPSGKYVRAIVDGQEWDSPFGRYFVRDIRPPLDPETTSASWDFRVYASEQGTITMRFDISSLEQYQVPEGFRAVAVVGQNEFDLLQSQTIQFEYTGGQVLVHIEASLDLTSVNNSDGGLPRDYALAEANPNPFNPTTVLRVSLPERCELQVTVYNVIGQRVTLLADGHFTAGYHNLLFDGSRLSSGIYFVHAHVPSKLNQVRRVLLLR